MSSCSRPEASAPCRDLSSAAHPHKRAGLDRGPRLASEPAMALTIYGSPNSRAIRVLWAAKELGLAFEHVPLAWNDPRLKSPAFLRINPDGRVPAIEDDGFVLSESLAITLYLAKK